MNQLPKKSIASIFCKRLRIASSKINPIDLMVNATIILALVLLLGVASEHGHARDQSDGSFEGEVMRVVDGDTVVILGRDRRQHRVRMAGIDAPESSQPHGMESTRALERLVVGKVVLVRVSAVDGHGRTVGALVLNGRDINHQMVLDGHAWHFKPRRADVLGINDRYAMAQARAQAARLGLWSKARPVAPWEWRN